MPETTLKKQMEAEWDDLFVRIKDETLELQINRIANHARHSVAFLAGEIDKIRG
jgi:hypothetical protein